MAVKTAALTRRALLAYGGATGLSSCVRWIPPAPPLPPLTKRPVFDIHCHIFNARDLPIRGFLDAIYISPSPGLAHYGEEVVVGLLAAIMDGQAIAASNEASQLNGGATRQQAVGFVGATEVTAKTDADLLRSSVARGAAKLLVAAPPELHAMPLATAGRRIKSATELFADKISLLNAIANPEGSGRSHAFSLAAPIPALNPQAVAEGAVRAFQQLGVGSEIHGLLWMASLLTRPRYELAARLFALANRDGGDVQILAPAIIDFSYWLSPKANGKPTEPVTSLSDQIAVMTAIAAHPQPGRAVHGWISYCPWRQIEEPAQYDMVVEAIENGGALGVKLYPVMGFYAIGNEQAQARGERYNCELEQGYRTFGKMLDDNLRKIYAYCADRGVPILAHCSHSEFPHLLDCNKKVLDSTDLGLRGGPTGNGTGWDSVLAAYPRLRLDIGHGGGPWDILKAGDPASRWTSDVVKLIGRSNKAYADISDYDAIFAKDQTEDAAILAKLKTYFDATPTARGKLMYGTDWLMLSRALGADAYYPQMRNRLPAALGFDQAQTDGYFGKNAAALTGLQAIGNDKPETRKRLERFYDAKNLDKTVLGLFDVRANA